MIVWLPLSDIQPFDDCHRPSHKKAGFYTFDKSGNTTREHIEGALICRDMVLAGEKVRPIAVVKMKAVPHARRTKGFAYQRVDGFKRFWGHKLAGAKTIPCIVFQKYRLGVQHGQSMKIGEEEWARLSTS